MRGAGECPLVHRPGLRARRRLGRSLRSAPRGSEGGKPLGFSFTTSRPRARASGSDSGSAGSEGDRMECTKLPPTAPAPVHLGWELLAMRPGRERASHRVGSAVGTGGRPAALAGSPCSPAAGPSLWEEKERYCGRGWEEAGSGTQMFCNGTLALELTFQLYLQSTRHETTPRVGPPR